ncbi:TPA: UDP-N-acetylglucosamine--undecaprenyl-phosphate N-acetylglucosaminephosphotransferase [Vibrio cholerae]|uniref:UDP-N-acetylglucosamine--undecaprenyl-phosphate N-acetylglucosaminephosphotransferase n=1 Tax=Vibrio cholerae TaxID=666 RepID=UPI000E64AD95|nr:UDP-N-acetylglucosamine--undecaprenyl-phosphate N-acetylglucosaminephosphotransferase [Vibrio cholerae]EGQ8316081.1 UDP-N-acetylglucosamine--undecaprenyl-phosphate N-acetylglucosaminephosphotransferase [Vibrio cholerae]EGR4247702.1 undecaprenyl-phosphate alpha-N-acetylglucosaminyl 1-phosphate transferase [Vibrio cholerae]EHY9847361.1 UDP-N-acetylglucosamine--undecaprenyl-phosphate N-acetylglucosaminephosphotransferase [Vibrio cholerae]MCX9546630.1 UDP-N-acetylglucosamine--undecaprenyl-phosph
MFMEISIIFALSTTLLFVMRKIAKKIGLVDKPNARKLHQGVIPLVGGISICSTLTLYLLFNPNLFPHQTLYLMSIIVLTLVGALDDKYDLSVKARMTVQALLSILMMYQTGIDLNYIGNILGIGDIHLGMFAAVVTIFAVIGAINAFNMVDGIDGLLGGLSMVTFGGIGILAFVNGSLGFSQLCTLLVITMLPYIMFNLGIFGRKRKVFMGDAGSMMIGFTAIWLLLGLSQNENQHTMRPITALWLIAIPLMDMAAIMIRRIRRGHSPFKPDREHLHHIFQRLGLSSHQTLAVICAFAALFAAFGIYGEMKKIPEPVMFFSFMLCFLVYSLLLAYVWRITSFLRRVFGRGEKELEQSISNF